MLEGIALVDTPGVDSIIDRHQEITEHFLPRADLVLFAFSVLNPYSKAAWDFFDLVAATWRRKVVFVLTQADLASPEQLSVNTARLRELAADRGLVDPPLFLVSATVGRVDPEAGGIEALRRHIRDMNWPESSPTFSSRPTAIRNTPRCGKRARTRFCARPRPWPWPTRRRIRAGGLRTAPSP